MAKRIATAKGAANKAETPLKDIVLQEKKTTVKALKSPSKLKKSVDQTSDVHSSKSAEKTPKKVAKTTLKKAENVDKSESADLKKSSSKSTKEVLPKLEKAKKDISKPSAEKTKSPRKKNPVNPKIDETSGHPEAKPVQNIEQSLEADNLPQNDEQLSEIVDQPGEEKLSRRERRLREWRERKKQKKMQSMLERQGQKPAEEQIDNDVQPKEPKEPRKLEFIPASKVKEMALEQQAAAEKEQISLKEEVQEEMPVEKKDKKPQERVAKQQSVVPLDKVGQDFPAPQKVDYGLGAHAKAKVEPVPRELESIISKTVQFLEREIRIHKPATILCGVSGGIDSVVLLDIMSVISTRGWCTIHIAHCNHSLRGEESHQDELFVRRLAGKYGLHFHHTTADVASYAKEYSLGIELAARTIRYQFFDKAAKGCHADYVATGHNAEDNAETLMMNLMRGSGITGLAGIPPRRDIDKKLSYIRPILWLSRKEIERYAKVRSLEWREDETNSSVAFTRNKIRHELLPKLREEYSPGLTEVLNRTTSLMREAQEFIAERILNIMQKGVKEINKTSFAIQIGMFQSVKDFAKGELIQAALRKHLHMQPIPMNSIDKVIQMAAGPAGGQVDINKELSVVREREEIVFSKREPHIDVFIPLSKLGTYNASGVQYHGEIAQPGTIAFGAHPLIEYFDAGLLPDQLVLRHWRDGDRLRPLGMEGTMTVSDFLANVKVRVADKRNVFVLCSGEEVYWVVGHRINDAFKVTQATNDILRVTITLPGEKQQKSDQEKPKGNNPKHKPVHGNGPKHQNNGPKHLKQQQQQESDMSLQSPKQMAIESQTNDKVEGVKASKSEKTPQPKKAAKGPLPKKKK